MQFNLVNGLNLLNGVRDRLLSRGWRRGFIIYRDNRPRCLLDSIDIVSQDLNISYQDTTQVEDLLRDIVCSQDIYNKFSVIPGDPYSVSLISWNDYKHRKFSHILDLIDTGISIILSEMNSDNSK